jgi:hypothetical protein
MACTYILLPHPAELTLFQPKTLYRQTGGPVRPLPELAGRDLKLRSKVVCCVHSRPASTVDSVLRLIAVQNLLCWLACYAHNGPLSLKYQYSLGISSLCLSSLWFQPGGVNYSSLCSQLSQHMGRTTVHSANLITCPNQMV